MPSKNSAGAHQRRQADGPDSIDLTPLQILAEVASKQPYLPTREPPAEGLLLLARAAEAVLGSAPSSPSSLPQATTTTTAPVATTDPVANNNNTSNNGNLNEATNQAPSRQPKKAPKNPSFIPDRPLLGRIKRSTPKPGRSASRAARDSAQTTGIHRAITSHGNNDGDETANDTIYVSAGVSNTAAGAITVAAAASAAAPTSISAGTPSPAEEVKDKSSGKCAACEEAGKARCQVVKRAKYCGACLRCVTRGETKRCSLYEGR